MELIGKTLQTTTIVDASMTIDNVICALRRISGLCHMLGHIGETASDIKAEHLMYTLSFIRDGLDDQIELLDAIQWPEGKAVGA